MITEFLTTTEKLALNKELKEGNSQIVFNILMHEIDRLQSIIRDYEIALKTSSDRLKSESFKKPIYRSVGQVEKEN